MRPWLCAIVALLAGCAAVRQVGSEVDADARPDASVPDDPDADDGPGGEPGPDPDLVPDADPDVAPDADPEPADADPDDAEPDADEPPETGEVACWTTASEPLGGHIALLEVDMATGAWEEIGLYDQYIHNPLHVSGMAHLDGKLVLAASLSAHISDYVWLEIDLATGEVRQPGESSMVRSLSVYHDQILSGCSNSDPRLCLFPDADALAGNRPSEVLGATGSDRCGVSGDEAYCMSFVDDAASVISLIDGSVLRDIALEGYNTYVEGVSLAGGSLFVMDDGREHSWIPHIVSFDPETGTRLGDVAVDVDHTTYDRPSGLWCESPRPELP